MNNIKKLIQYFEVFSSSIFILHFWKFILPHCMKHWLIRSHVSVMRMMRSWTMMIQMIQRMRRMMRMVRLMRMWIVINVVITSTNSVPIRHYDHHFWNKTHVFINNLHTINKKIKVQTHKHLFRNKTIYIKHLWNCFSFITLSNVNS